MIDISVAYNRYRFLGHEFLTWLWYAIDREPTLLRDIDPQGGELQVGNRIALENRNGEAVETITIKGDAAGLEEGLLALRKGALVTEMNLIYTRRESQWQATVKGESLHLTGIKTPSAGTPETEADVEGAILEKGFLVDQLVSQLDRLMSHFMALRLSVGWDETCVPAVQAWLSSRTTGA